MWLLLLGAAAAQSPSAPRAVIYIPAVPNAGQISCVMTGEDGKSGAFKIGFDGKAPLGVAGAKLIFNAESQDFSMLAGRYKVIQWPVSGVDLFMEHGRVFTTAKFLFNYERTRSGVVMISVNDLSDRSYRFFHGQCTSTLFRASSEPIEGGQP